MFLRLFFLTFSLFIDLYACQGGYTSCIAKVKDSNTIQNNQIQIPLHSKRRLLYTTIKPNAKILKYDPFLSLYLIEDKKPFAYPFDFNMHLQLATAMVSDKSSCEGKISTNQIGLNSLAKYNKPLLLPSILTTSCCTLEGIVTPHGIIQKEYLKHFIDLKKSKYADLGIRVKNKNHLVVITAVDPFFKNNPFKIGDNVVGFDSKRIYKASILMQKILFSQVGVKHTLKIKRGSKYLIFDSITVQRYGGGAISDTFLESQGLYFDNTLTLIKVEKKFAHYGLQKGDRLIQINGKRVKNQKELRQNLEKFKNYASLLFERNGFEFFVNIK